VNSFLLDEANKLEPELVSLRRDIHQHPELAFTEERTSSIVADHLESLGMEVIRKVAGTGVIGLLRGAAPGPTIGLRADMDALPILEENDVSYKSQNLGKSHACGHDSHTTMLLGAAKLLAEQGIKKGNVKFVFQPAEEIGAGAKAMIEAGALHNPEVDAMASLHVNADVDVAMIGINDKVGCGSVDTFVLRIIGSGGHAAHPDLTIDSIIVTAEVITALQHISSRMIAPEDPVVVTIGTIHGGMKENVIAPNVELTGTVRTLNPTTRKKVPEMMERIVKGVTAAFSATYELDYRLNCPSVLNDEKMTEIAERTVAKVIGVGHVQHKKSGLGGEDFSYYSEQVPSVFFRLGVGSDQIPRHPNHHPQFNIDETALPYGSAMLAGVALEYLDQL